MAGDTFYVFNHKLRCIYAVVWVSLQSSAEEDSLKAGCAVIELVVPGCR